MLRAVSWVPGMPRHIRNMKVANCWNKILQKAFSLDRCREVLIKLANYHIRQIEKKPCCWASAWCKRDAASRRRRMRVAKSFLLILPPLYPPPLCVDDWKIKKIRFNSLAPSPPNHIYRPINWQANSWGCVVFEEGWISEHWTVGSGQCSRIGDEQTVEYLTSTFDVEISGVSQNQLAPGLCPPVSCAVPTTRV